MLLQYNWVLSFPRGVYLYFVLYFFPIPADLFENYNFILFIIFFLFARSTALFRDE